jgi:arginase
MHARMIEVPSMAGDEDHPASAGPGRFLNAGAAGVLAGQGMAVTVGRAERPGAFRDTVSATAAVNQVVAASVAEAVAVGQLPLVLAGSCVAAHGVLAGFDHARCGVVWVDAHADFNTPATTQSGFFPGMSLAVITGDCHRDYWARIGDSAPVAEEAVVLLGTRDLSPEAERERLARSAIQVVPWRDGRPQGDVTAVLDTLAARVPEVYLHIDFDGFAPEVAPGIVDEPVPGGLSRADAETIVRATSERFRIRAATLATYTPAHDRDDRTLRLGLRLLELIAGQAAGPRRAAG